MLSLPYIVLLTLNIKNSDDIVIARQRAKQITELLHLDTQSQTKLATVVSEISRNACLYAGGGKIEYCLSKNPLGRTLIARITDKGPGIDNLSAILAGEHATGRGISGSNRIMDRLVINTSAQGTEVIAEINLPKNIPLITSALIARISEALVKNRPRKASEEVEQQNQELLQALDLLSKHRNELEKRVEERTRELAVINQELQQEIIDRKRAEEWMQTHQQELARVERTNSMGELANTLAHELNQPLASISTYTQGCIKRLTQNDFIKQEIIEIMKLVVKQAQRAGKITHRMKNFVRQGELIKEKSDINHIIEETIAVMQHEIRKYQVEIQFDLGKSLPPIDIDTIQIQQVISNLVRNALQAMKKFKTVTPAIIIKTTAKNKEEIKIEVRDSGPGINPEHLNCILDPYFTTKKNGMGIGLAISKNVIEAHGGILDVKNNPAGGAWFGFTLPLIRSKKA